MTEENKTKNEVKDFWNSESCGERYSIHAGDDSYYQAQYDSRYKLEPWITDFADFESGRDRDILEIGTGMGADHINWARSGPRSLTGIDLTERAVSHTRDRFAAAGLDSNLMVGDAENLDFADETFDIVYTYGVIHHSPDTKACVDEIYRVLAKDGTARVMIYHKHSLVGLMLWARYGLFRLRPLVGLDELYANYLESPGTKAFSISGAQKMFQDFDTVHIETRLSIGDLLQGDVGARHQGFPLRVLKTVWPRKVLGRFFSKYGLVMMITACKEVRPLGD